MERTPLPVYGYTNQGDEKIATVNVNKMLEEKLLRRLDDLLSHPDINIDKQWASIARTHFEEGFMALNRSIFKPTRIDGDV